MIELTFRLQPMLPRYRSQRKASNDTEWLQHPQIGDISPHYCTKGISCLKIELCLSVWAQHHPALVWNPHAQEHPAWEAQIHQECQLWGRC